MHFFVLLFVLSLFQTYPYILLYKLVIIHFYLLLNDANYCIVLFVLQNKIVGPRILCFILVNQQTPSCVFDSNIASCKAMLYITVTTLQHGCFVSIIIGNFYLSYIVDMCINCILKYLESTKDRIHYNNSL